MPKGPSHLAGALAELDHRYSRSGEVRAYAFSPVTYDDMHRNLRRAQVAGLERAHTSVPQNSNASFTVWVADDIGMSTGKAAAQTAHAVCLLCLQVSDALGDWSLRFAPAAALAAARNPLVRVVDNGRTEIEPGP